MKGVSHKSRHFLFVVVFFLAIFVSMLVSVSSADENQYVPGRIIIKFKSEPLKTFSTSATGFASIDAIMIKYNILTAEPLSKIESGDTVGESIGLNRIYVLSLPDSVNIQEALSSFSADPNIEYAELDYFAEPAWIPNDPYFSAGYQWNLNNMYNTDINAPQTWDITKGLASVELAILDTGVYFNHEDLIGKKGHRCGCPTGCDSDTYFHGTHVAGIAAASTNNAIGIAGVCPNCKILSYNVCTPTPLNCYTPPVVLTLIYTML
jgi:subtilisin family serine protease